MRLAVIICFLFVGSTLVSNVESTHLPILHDLLLSPLREGVGIFNEFFEVLTNIFNGQIQGFHHFIDGVIKGFPNVLEGVFGDENFGKFLGPLSQIPDGADLNSILGEKLRGKSDIFGLLVQLAKKFCVLEKCSLLDVAGKPLEFGKDFRKELKNVLEGFDKNIDGFHTGLEGLMSSLDPTKKNEIFRCLSKLPDDFDPSEILGKIDAPESIKGILSRQDIFPILVKFAKLKCKKGCDKQ